MILVIIFITVTVSCLMIKVYFSGADYTLHLCLQIQRFVFSLNCLNLIASRGFGVVLVLYKIRSIFAHK